MLYPRRRIVACTADLKYSNGLFRFQERHPERFKVAATPRRVVPQHAPKAKPPAKGESAPWVSRPALCVQPREGKLYIFMPPVEYLADYLDLADFGLGTQQ